MHVVYSIDVNVHRITDDDMLKELHNLSVIVHLIRKEIVHKDVPVQNSVY